MIMWQNQQYAAQNIAACKQKAYCESSAMAASQSVTVEGLLRGLECTVCQEPYREPTILPCGHTFCLKPCLEQVARFSLKVKCPECRTEHFVPASGVQGFAKNIAVARQLAEQPSPTVDKLDHLGCPICGEEDDLGKCAHCGMFLCECCKLRHIPKLKQKMKDYAYEVIDRATYETSAVVALEAEAQANVNNLADAAVLQVDHLGEMMAQSVTHKMSELKKAIEDIRGQKIKTISTTTELAKNVWRDVTKLCHQRTCQLSEEDVILSHSKLAKLYSKFVMEVQRASDIHTEARESIRQTEHPNILVNMDVTCFECVIRNFSVDTEAITLP